MKQLSIDTQWRIQDPISWGIPIDKITKDRKSFTTDMDSDLMHSSCMDFDFQKGYRAKLWMFDKFFQPAFSFGFQSRIKIYFDLWSIKFFIVGLGQWFFDNKMCRELSQNEGKIIFVYISFSDDTIDIL